MNRMDIINCNLDELFEQHLDVKSYPLLPMYKDTVQDTVWHAEGDVHIHTDMVLNHVRVLIDHYKLTESDSIVLYLAAVFHDYAKPITTGTTFRHDRLCITAKGHEESAASRLRLSTKPNFVTEKEWTTIIELVRYHDQPKTMIVKNRTLTHYWNLWIKCPRIDLLYMLEVADMIGRTCPDKEQQVEYIDLFKYMAECFGVYQLDPEQLKTQCIDNICSCWPHLQPSADRIYHVLLSRFADIYNEDMVYLFEHTSNWSADQMMYYMQNKIGLGYGYNLPHRPHLVVLCGLPGAGKSTFIEQNLPGYKVISLDAIRESITTRSDQSNNDAVVRIAKHSLCAALLDGQNVVYDATSYRKDFRSPITDIGFNYHAVTEIIMLCTTLPECIERNGTRPEAHRVPVQVIQDMFEKYQLPSIDECHKLTWIVK